MKILFCILENFAYIASIVLQLTAAVLLVGNTDTRRAKIITSYFEARKMIAFNQDNKLVDTDGLKEFVKSTWVNKIAFSYLFVGYLIGVFGTCTMNKWLAFLIISILVALLFLATHKYAMHKGMDFLTISADEIPRRKGTTVMRPVGTICKNDNKS